MYVSLTAQEREQIKADRVDVTVHPGSLSEFVRLIPNPKGSMAIGEETDCKVHPYRIAVLHRKGIRHFGAEDVTVQKTGAGILILCKPVKMVPPNPLKGQGRKYKKDAVKANGNGAVQVNGVTTIDNVFDLQDRINSIKQTLGNNIVLSVREDGTLRITMDR